MTWRGLLAAFGVPAFLACSMPLAAAPPATTAPSTAPVTDDDALVFLPDDGDDPNTRIGTGARALATGPSVFLLVSQKTGKTVSPHPTIYWYLTGDTDADAQVLVSKPGDAKPIVKKTLAGPKTAGIHSFSLAEEGVDLEPDTLYQVTVCLWLEAKESGANPFSGGFLRRVGPPAALTGAAAAAGPDPAAYARAGLWYDALDALCRRVREDSSDARPRKQRLSLLRQEHVFLTFTPPEGYGDLPAVRKAAEEAETAERQRLADLEAQDAKELPARRDQKPLGQ